MEKFDEILYNIQKELLELKEINNSLQKENELLREQLETYISSKKYDISLEDAFREFSFKESPKGIKLRILNNLRRAGYNSIGDFNDVGIYDLLKIRNTGASTCSILIILLEHFGIQVELPDIENVTGSTECSLLKEIHKELERNKENIVFKK